MAHRCGGRTIHQSSIPRSSHESGGQPSRVLRVPTTNPRSYSAPEEGNYTALTWTTVCPGGGFYQINETQVQSGQWIGVKIPLTGQTHVTCTAWLGPHGGLMSSYANDTADSSLGSVEADCLRQVP